MQKKGITGPPLRGGGSEIVWTVRFVISVIVAPLVGAWIEITESETESEPEESLPSWERGLK